MAFGALPDQPLARREAVNAARCFLFSSGLVIFTGKPERQAFRSHHGGYWALSWEGPFC